ncbi:MAG: hypothetical protein NDI61_08990 [Bdellovibrionaceae bacterium]|nr:hypothetical protein [Pseudobdellovibrionaceae bacterium]
MKTDLNSIKTELQRLTDLDYLKKELGQIKADIKKFDIRIKMSPQAKSRLKQLESRFHDIRNKMTALQKQVDSEVNKLIQTLRSAGIAGTTSKRQTTRKKSSVRKARTTKRKSARR